MNFMSRHFHGNQYLARDQVKWRIDLSITQIDRLEKSGAFPERVRLVGRRVGWLEAEITSWMQEKVDARPDAEHIVVRPEDYFIGEAATCRFTSLSRHTVERYERSGAFPAAIRICEGRRVRLEREIRTWRESSGTHLSSA